MSTAQADSGDAIRMRFDRGGLHLFDELALRVRLGAHAALFADNAALLIELPVDGVKEARGFEIKPELDAVSRVVEKSAESSLALAFMLTPPFFFDDAGRLSTTKERAFR